MFVWIILNSKVLDPLNGTFLCVKGKSRSKVKFSRHPISDPPYQLHVRPRRLAGHVHAPNQGQEIGILRPCKQLVCPHFFSLLFKTFFYIPYVPQKYIVSPSIYAFCYEKVVYSNSAGSREPRIWMNSLSFSKQRKQSYKLSLQPVMRVCVC